MDSPSGPSSLNIGSPNGNKMRPIIISNIPHTIIFSLTIR